MQAPAWCCPWTASCTVTHMPVGVEWSENTLLNVCPLSIIPHEVKIQGCTHVYLGPLGPFLTPKQALVERKSDRFCQSDKCWKCQPAS
jgi:hypothetical protein